MEVCVQIWLLKEIVVHMETFTQNILSQISTINHHDHKQNSLFCHLECYCACLVPFQQLTVRNPIPAMISFVMVLFPYIL